MTMFHVTQHETRSIEWWFEQLKADRLDLEPDFQRRSNLWSKYKQAHLIDSIINGYDLPKFYVADFTLARSTLNSARRPYAVVDGKQRFGSIFSFLRDEIPLNKSTKFELDADLSIKGMKFSQLVRDFPDLAKKILSFKPVVMSIVTDERDKISEMFVRLNSGEAANSAERRNAQPGPIPVLVRELIDHAFFRNRISFTKKRMADYQLAAKLLLIEYRGGPADTKAKDMDSFVKTAAAETLPPQFEEATPENSAALQRYEAVAERVIEVLERLAEAFEDEDPLLGASGRIPIYYLVLRDHPEAIDNFRDFVEDFERRVLEAMRADRAAASSGAESHSGIYGTYYTLSRSQNDQSSMRDRVRLMNAELKRRNLI